MRPLPPLLSHQERAVKKICGPWRDRSICLGDEMGLGKTRTVIESWERLYRHKDYVNILILCPASVVPVWSSEIDTWCQEKQLVQCIKSKKDVLDWPEERTFIVVSSYDLAVSKGIAKQILYPWDLLVFDESHHLGNPDSKRTKLCLGSLHKRAAKTICVTGSIQRDKIINVWPVFRTLCPEAIPTYWKFVEQFTYHKRTKYGIKILGGKNLGELGLLARKNFLIRRTKAQVAKSLPEKLEQRIVFELEDEEQRRLEQASKDFREEAKMALAGRQPPNDPAFSTLRRELGQEKVPYAEKVILDLLGLGASEESCGKLVVFCYHKSVFHMLRTFFEHHTISHVSLSGSSTQKARIHAIDSFQREPAISVFLGTFAAAEGIKLTAAQTALFVEMSWQLAQNEQAQDRLHRIGQESTVYIKYLLLKNTLDMVVYNTYKQKSRDKRKAFDEQPRPNSKASRTRRNGSTGD